MQNTHPYFAIGGGIFLISFVVSLKIQENRLKIPLEELPAHKKSKGKQRKTSLWIVIFSVIWIVVYFFIGKQAQLLPEVVPDEYFAPTRINENLSEEENGYIQFGNIFGRTTDTPEKLETIEQKYFLQKLDKIRFDDYQNTRTYRWKDYTTYRELFKDNPDYTTLIQQLEQTDFVSQIQRVVNLERQFNEKDLPTLKGIQIMNIIKNVSLYHIEQGNYAKAIEYNSLGLQLADKYLTSYGGVIQGLIGTTLMNIAIDTTEELLKYYLPPIHKQNLLTAYSSILATDKDTLRENIYKSEYHTLSKVVYDFDLTLPRLKELQRFYDLTQYLPFTEPFYSKEDTKNKLKYGLKYIIENKAIISIPQQTTFPQEIVNSQRNSYNIFGNRAIWIIFPMINGVNDVLEELYQFQQDTITKLSI